MVTLNPGLAPWAFLCRPFGACFAPNTSLSALYSGVNFHRSTTHPYTFHRRGIFLSWQANESVSLQIFAARMAFALQTLVQLKCFLWRFVLMHYGPHCLNHGHGSFRLKDVSPHVNTGCSLVYGFVGHA